MPTLTIINHKLSIEKFSPDEDAQLLSLVSRHAAGKWAAVAAEMEGRSGDQAKARWLRIADIADVKGQVANSRKRRITDPPDYYRGGKSKKLLGDEDMNVTLVLKPAE